jgi:predicted dehydrogenase
MANQSGVYPEVDDCGIAHIQFESGILGTIEAAWTQTSGPGGLEIVGSEKSLWHNGRQYVMAAPGGSEEVLQLTVPAEPDRMDRLVAVIRNRIPASELQRDLEACFDAVRMIESAYRSNDRSAWISAPA